MLEDRVIRDPWATLVLRDLLESKALSDALVQKAPRAHLDLQV